MLTILHGKDTTASYLGLQKLLSTYSGFQKVRLSAEDSQALYQELFTQDIFDTQKVIIAEDILSLKEFNADNLKNIPKTLNVIFWEKKELTQSILEKLPTSSIVQIFKPNPVLFKFLDAIGIDSKLSLTLLQQLPDTNGGLTWQIENRILQVILIKVGLDITQVSKIIGKHIQNFQWNIMQNQSKYVSLSDLKRLFSSTLKLEMMIKSGLVNNDEKTLISLMLLKHS